MWEPLTPDVASWPLIVQWLNAEHQLLWFFSSALLTIASPQLPCICNPLQPHFWGSLCLFPILYPFSAPILGWTFILCRRKEGCVERAPAPISCGENGSLPQPGSWSGLWWAIQGQKGPERVQGNMQNTALKRQRINFPSPLLWSSSRKCENWYAKWMQRRIFFQQVLGSENFSPRWRKERWCALWRNFN